MISITAAPDDIGQVEAALRFAASAADLVVCSGGLGPTEDDVNREAFCRVFGCRLVSDEQALKMMQERFTRRRAGPMPAQNRCQALVPEHATVLYNEWGTAPGFLLLPREGAASALLALPGPPREMKPMFETLAEPLLRQLASGCGFVQTRTFHTFGLPESTVNERMRSLFRRDPRVAVTILAKQYGVDLRVTARGASPEEMKSLLGEYQALLKEQVGPLEVYGADEDTLPSVVAQLLIRHRKSVAVAESCTGGLLSKLLTDVPGSSGYFPAGFVTYANMAKQEVLGVSRGVLETHGAVSRQVARQMAAGAREKAGTDYALAVTGVAGPGGGTPQKPVGLVYIAIATAQKVQCGRWMFLADREQNRLLSSLTALDLLRRKLLSLDLDRRA